jgi:hypothetical protein
MKAILLSCAWALSWVVSAGAIPQTFQQPANLFVRAAGVNFEDFATDPGAADAATGLKGHWTAQGETLTLTETAVVFGIAADTITATEKDGHIGQYVVSYRGTDQKTGKPRDIAAPLMANIRAFTGDSGRKEAGQMAFNYKGVLIRVSLKPPGYDAVVTFIRD